MFDAMRICSLKGWFDARQDGLRTPIVVPRDHSRSELFVVHLVNWTASPGIHRCQSGQASNCGKGCLRVLTNCISIETRNSISNLFLNSEVWPVL